MAAVAALLPPVSDTVSRSRSIAAFMSPESGADAAAARDLR